MPSADADRIVAEVAAAVGLVEGVTGVRAVVATLARLEPVSIRRISRAAELPVPIVAAICGELRRRAVVSNERPARLTERGRKLYAAGALRLDPRGLGAVAAEIARATATAPPARVELDQCHCTFDTKVIMPTMPGSHYALDGILDNDLPIVEHPEGTDGPTLLTSPCPTCSASSSPRGSSTLCAPTFFTR